jgi:glycosyltransferase involved in cell wall biosynthesis
MFDPTKYSGDTARRIRSKYGIKENEKIVVYAGRLEKWAGVKIVLNCAERLKDSGTKFLLIGEGHQGTDAQQPNIIFSGRIPYEQVPSYLAAADLVLVPMEQDTVGDSASPLKLFEAMAMKKPIVASNTQGIREVITNEVEGVLLPQDEDMWVNTIRELLKDSNRAARLGENAEKRIKTEFDWNILVGELSKILLSTSGEHAT